MRRYLLDTSVLSALLHNRAATVSLITPWLRRHEVATSILVYGEVLEYIKTRPNFPSRAARLRDLLSEIRPYFLTYPILERYATIRLALRPPHGPGLIGDIDTLIAATALERNLTVLTADTDFQRVSGLSLMHLERATL